MFDAVLQGMLRGQTWKRSGDLCMISVLGNSGLSSAKEDTKQKHYHGNQLERVKVHEVQDTFSLHLSKLILPQSYVFTRWSFNPKILWYFSVLFHSFPTPRPCLSSTFARVRFWRKTREELIICQRVKWVDNIEIQTVCATE